MLRALLSPVFAVLWRLQVFFFSGFLVGVMRGLQWSIGLDESCRGKDWIHRVSMYRWEAPRPLFFLLRRPDDSSSSEPCPTGATSLACAMSSMQPAPRRAVAMRIMIAGTENAGEEGVWCGQQDSYTSCPGSTSCSGGNGSRRQIVLLPSRPLRHALRSTLRENV